MALAILLLAQTISVAAQNSWPEFRALGKCNVCQAVNEQFHGNIVTLLLALDSSVVSCQLASWAMGSAGSSGSSWATHLANACLIDLLMFTCACLARLLQLFGPGLGPGRTYNIAHNLL